jgi:hypothetical protein
MFLNSEKKEKNSEVLYCSLMDKPLARALSLINFDMSE